MIRRLMRLAPLAVGALALLACTGDGIPAATTIASTPGPATRTPARTPIPTILVPTASPAPPAEPPEPLFPTLRVAEAAPFPSGVVMFLWSGCTQCDGPPSALRRFQQVDGQIVEATIREAPPDGQLLHAWVDEAGALYVAECLGDQCGSQLEDSAEREAFVFRSMDDGDTWAPAGTVAGEPVILGGWDAGTVNLSRDDAGDGQFEVDGVPVDLTALDPRGQFADGFPPYGVLGPLQRTEDGGAIVHWYCRVAAGHSPVSYVTRFSAEGAPVWTYSGLPGVPLDEGRLVGTIAYRAEEIPQLGYTSPYPAWLPSVIDVGALTLHPIADPFLDDPLDRNIVVGIRAIE